MFGTPKAEPFRIAVPDAVLADLKARLALTRWPIEPKPSAAAPPWHYGAKLAFVQDAAIPTARLCRAASVSQVDIPDWSAHTFMLDLDVTERRRRHQLDEETARPPTCHFAILRL